MELQHSINPITGEIERNEFLDYDLKVSGKHSQVVTFYDESVLNNYKTEQARTPVFDTVLYVKIHTPGAKNEPVLPASELHKNRYKAEYEAYLNQKGPDYIAGTPIQHWPVITKAEASTLKAAKIYSVEQLSELSEMVASKIGINRNLIQKAREWSESAKSIEENSKLRSEIEKSREMMEAMQKQIEALVSKSSKAPSKAAKQEGDNA